MADTIAELRAALVGVDLNASTIDGVNLHGTATSPIVVSINQSSITGDMAVGGDLDVTGDTTLGGTLDVTGDATVTGDVAAAGGFRQAVGPFSATLAATQTDTATTHGVSGGAWVAPFAGSVMGVSGMVSAAITGAGTAVTVRVFKALAADLTSYSLLNAALNLSFTQAAGELGDTATAAKGAHTFAAGDALKIVYSSTAISNTPTFAGSIQVEC